MIFFRNVKAKSLKESMNLYTNIVVQIKYNVLSDILPTKIKSIGTKIFCCSLC